jgi:hypothetical protein
MRDVCIYERKDSPYWWIKYWCPTRLGFAYKSSGFRRDDPLGFKHALDTARPLSQEARAARKIAPSARWESWVEDWLREKHRTSPRSLACELLRWRWVSAFLEGRYVPGPQGVTYQLGLDYLKWRKSQVKRVSKKHPSHNTALQELRLWGRVMLEAVRRGFITASPLERMGIKRDKPAEKDEITDADVSAIRKALAKKESHLPIEQRWMTISFEIALYQGCRLQETSVPMTDINETAGTITFHAKRGKVFTTALHTKLMPLIRQLRAAGAARTCVLPRMASKEWHWLLKGRVERNWPAVCAHVCFHCTRVTVITRMARDGVPIQQAMAYVGHADETIHRIYQRLAPRDLGRCTQALVFSETNEPPQNPGVAVTTPAA